jgi:hypothetical protein
MANPNISVMLQQLLPASRTGSTATGSFSFVSGGSGDTGTFSGGEQRVCV